MGGVACGDWEPYPNLQDLGWSILLFSSVAAIAVLMTTANLTVSAQRRSYALWQLANVSPRQVSRVVLAQLATWRCWGGLRRARCWRRPRSSRCSLGVQLAVLSAHRPGGMPGGRAVAAPRGSRWRRCSRSAAA